MSDCQFLAEGQMRWTLDSGQTTLSLRSTHLELLFRPRIVDSNEKCFAHFGFNALDTQTSDALMLSDHGNFTSPMRGWNEGTNSGIRALA